MLSVPGGETIKRFREARGLTQQQLAVELGRSVATVTQWETDRIHPRRGSAERLDEHLGAEGEILSALGYVDPTSRAAEIKELRQELAEHRAELDEMHALLSEMTAVFEQISASGEVRGSWPARAGG